MREEGHYTIKRIKKLPKKGNSNLLYAIKTEDEAIDTIEKLYRWLPTGKYQEISVGGGTGGTVDGSETIVQSGTNVTVTGTGTAGDPYIINSTGSGSDNWGTQSVVSDGTLTGDGTPGNALSVSSPYVAPDGSETVITPGDNISVTGTGTLTTPYVISSSFPTGLEAIDEGNGIGWRLIGQDVNNYGDIGEDAVNLSISSSASTTRGSTGRWSFTAGLNSTASGDYTVAIGANSLSSGTFGSVAIGSNSQATGSNSTAIGQGTATGDSSISIGTFSQATGNGAIALGAAISSGSIASNRSAFAAVGGEASGETSISFGEGTLSRSYGENVIGLYSTDYTPNSTTAIIAADRLFTIGNGVNDLTRRDALSVLKSGLITAPSLTTTIIDAEATGKVLITKEWFNANNTGGGSTPTGLEAIDEGNGIGWRLIGRDSNNFGNIGENAVDFTFSTIASSTFGATGQRAFAVGGFGTIASGEFSIAMGQSSVASSGNAIALGANNTSSGGFSFTTNASNNADGTYAASLGFNNLSPSYAEMTVGHYATNYTPVSQTAIDLTDRLFNIGNGASNVLRSDAFTLLKSGLITAPSLTNALIDASATGRELITVDWFNANSSGGGSNLYNLNGTLTSERTLTFGGFNLLFQGTSNDSYFNDTSSVLEANEVIVSTIDGSGLNAANGGSTELIGLNGLQIRPGTLGVPTPTVIGQTLVTIGTSGECEWQTLPSGLTKASTNIGDGVLTTITVTHNLGTEDFAGRPLIVDNGTKEIVDTTMVIVDANNVSFTFTTAPTLNQFRVTITG